MKLLHKIIVVFTIGLISCRKESTTSGFVAVEATTNINYYSIIDGRAEIEPALNEVVLPFGNDSSCALVLDKGRNIFNQENLEEITNNLLKTNNSCDILYSYSHGFRRACTIYRDVRATSK